MSSGKILLGVLAGIAACITVWVLFAPEKGSMTRRKLVKKGNDGARDSMVKPGTWLKEQEQAEALRAGKPHTQPQVSKT